MKYRNQRFLDICNAIGFALNKFISAVNKHETNIVRKTSMEGKVCTSFEYVLSVISSCNKRDLLTPQDFFTWHTAKFYSYSYSVKQT